MTQRFYKSLLAILVLVSTLGVQAQSGREKNAAKKLNDYAFVNAREAYLGLVDNGEASAEVFQNLGDSYYQTAEYTEAAKWYAKLFSDDVTTDTDIDPDYYYKYAQTLKSLEMYEESDAQMEKFNRLKGGDARAALFTQDRNYLQEINERSGRYTLESVRFNSELQDFGPSFYGDSLVFSSNRKSTTGDYKHDWNEQPYLDLFMVKDLTSETPAVDKFNKEVNTPYHESTSVFTKNGDVMYFTRNNYTKKKLRKDGSGTTKLKLYRTVLTGDKWSTPEELPFNSDEFSTAHPTLSPDEQTLYFASDRPGTMGLSDLWKVNLTEDGGFTTPVNLGDKINTEGRETFPFVTESNQLFFASDGQAGLGGLDIYTTQLEGNGVAQDPFNIGKPVNSSADDFGFIYNNQANVGYFASNRATGLGNDDIYKVSYTYVEPPCEQSITGIVRDRDTQQIIPGATVELRNVENELLGTQTSDAQGRVSFAGPFPCETPYVIKASKQTYNPGEDTLRTGTETGGVANLDLSLEPKLQLNVGDDLAKILNLNPIYFDFDKAYIRPDAAYELQKVIAVMNEYPTLKIDVRSHTDSRGRDAYNLDLSQRRNTSTKEYIINKGGISSSRITGRGYGETSPVNQCTNGVKCSEEEHQLNRRSEFIIVSR